MTKKTIRLKLADFINSPIEDTIISFLQMIKKETPTFNVVFWYDKNDVDSNSLLEFRKKYKDDIEQLEIDIKQIHSFNESVWFDIISTKDAERLQQFKFRSTYENADNIIDCIMEFNSMIKFDTQKNNGYRNGKDRNYRFKTVGKQAKD